MERQARGGGDAAMVDADEGDAGGGPDCCDFFEGFEDAGEKAVLPPGVYSCRLRRLDERRSGVRTF